MAKVVCSLLTVRRSYETPFWGGQRLGRVAEPLRLSAHGNEGWEGCGES